MQLGDDIDTSVIDAMDKELRMLDIFYVVIDKKGDNLFEIIESVEIYKPMYKDKKYLLIGVFSGKSKAVKYILHLLEKYLETGRDMKRAKSYFVLHFS